MIRKATIDDLFLVAELVKKIADFHHALDPHYKPSSNFKNLEEDISDWFTDKDGVVFVAENAEKIIGYVRGSVEEAPYYASAKKIGVLNDIIVEEKYRRRGVAKELFARLLDWFKMKNIKNIELSVDVRNKEGEAFWRALGFLDYKLRMRKDI